MHLSRLALILLAVVALACGGTGSGGPAGASSSSGGSGGGSGSGASSGGGSGSGGSSGSSSGGGDDAGVVGDDSGVPGSDQTLTLTMGPFTVPGGSEVFKCQTFANPFGGKDTDIKAYEEHMTLGSHHMFLFFSPGATDGPIQDCPSGGLEFHPYPFSAQSKDATLTYPPTVGSLIPHTMGFMLNGHFLNTTATAYQATLTVTLHLATPGTVTQHAGVVFMNNVSIDIPPKGTTPTTATATCTMPQDLNVMASASHMHQRATNFVATSGTQMLYQTTSWTDPIPGVYTPALQLAKGSQVTFSCTYVNETPSDLTFGESATTNVMCIYSMQFYPVVDPTNPTIVCEK